MEHSAHHGPTTWLTQIPLLPHDPKYAHVNGALLILALLFMVGLIVKRSLAKRSDGYLIPDKRVTLLSLVDSLVEGLYKMVEGTLGPQADKHFPFIASLFIFVLLNNLLGLLPLSISPTGSTSTTFAIGLASFLYYNVMGIKEHGVKGYLQHFLMGLGPFGIVIAVLEMVSHLIRPFSLGIRLYVNMFVDHAVAGSFQSLFAWLVPVPLLLFGIVVCTIQAFVFAMLSAIYIEIATEHEEEHHGAHAAEAHH